MPLVHRIKIPKLGMAVDEATLSEWLVTDGARVDVDTPHLRGGHRQGRPGNHVTRGGDHPSDW